MFSGFSRRQLLRLISLLVAGTASVGSVPLIGKFFASIAQAQETTEEVYKNRKYKILTKDVDETPQTIQEGSQTIVTPYTAPIELYIDDKKVSVIRDKKKKKYRTYLLPFAEYDSPKNLAIALIESGVQIPNGRLKLKSNVK